MKKFIYQFFSLFSGTTISQLIPFLVTPILTRLYLPSEFGEYAIYIAIVSILYVFATGRYELALLNTNNKKELNNLFFIPIILSMIFNISLLIFLIIFGDFILNKIQYDSLMEWKLLIPLSIFIMTIFQTIYFLFNKQEKYNLMAINLVIQSLSIAISNIYFGINNLGIGLIGSYVIGQLVASIIIVLNLFRLKTIDLRVINLKGMKVQLIEHINFPRYLILSHLSNRLGLQSSIILFTKYYNSEQVGNFSLTHRILKTPLALFGNTIGQVFRQKASVQLKKNQECKKLYLYTFLILFLIGLLPFSIIFLYSEEIFIFVLGEEWKQAGFYAQLLTPMLFAQFCAGPLTSIFMLSGKQKIDLYWQLTTLMLSVITIILTSIYFKSIEISIISYSLVYVGMYLVSIVLTYRIAKGNKKVVG